MGSAATSSWSGFKLCDRKAKELVYQLGVLGSMERPGPAQ